jgi:hypothetical protein
MTGRRLGAGERPRARIGVALVAAAGLGGLVWRTTERNKAERAERAFFEGAGVGSGRFGGGGARDAAADHAVRRHARRRAGDLILVQSLYDQGSSRTGWPFSGAPTSRRSSPTGCSSSAPLGWREPAGRPRPPGYGVSPGPQGCRRGGVTSSARRRREHTCSAATEQRPTALGADRRDNASPLVDEARVRVGELSAG